ncbi:MAG: hypothetical protein QOC40_11210, partial [Nitrososphaeraceae archaeon]|nr:hypothetical protein [Nitrososphaeraceae archaeon]
LVLQRRFKTNTLPRQDITSMNTTVLNANFFVLNILQDIIRILVNKNFGIKLLKPRTDFQNFQALSIIPSGQAIWVIEISFGLKPD